MSSPAEDLRFIRDAIADARSAFAPDARPITVWASLTLVGIALSYAVPRLDSAYLWLVVIGVAWLYTGRRALRRAAAPDAVSFATHVLATVWFGAFTAATIVGFVGYFSGTILPSAIPPIHASLFGAATLISGAIVGARWLVAVGFLWWLASIALFLLPGPLRLAAFGVALAVLLLVPSLLARALPSRSRSG